MNAMTSSGGAVKAVTDEQILDGVPVPGRDRGSLLRAGVGRERRRACSPTAPATASAGSCACSPATASRIPQTALEQAGAVVPCDPELRRDRARGARVTPVARRRLVRVPASSANLGPGFDVLGGRARAAPRARGGRDRHVRRARPSSTCPRDRDNLVVRAFERLHPADGFEFRISSRDPAVSGGLGSSAAAIVAGLLAADHLFELDADVLGARRPSSRVIPTTSAAALDGGFVVCDGAARAPLRAADGARGGARRPATRRSRPRRAREALPDVRPARGRGVQHRRTPRC